MNVLVLNCGSSSLKFQLIQTDPDRIVSSTDRRLAKGIIERIGSQCLISLQVEGLPMQKLAAPLRDHKAAIDYVLRWLVSETSGIEEVKTHADVHVIGHRVVHGGEKFKASVKIDPLVLKDIEDCIELAPLHNPANLEGIYAITSIMGGGVPQVAVFDTSFHAQMPEASFLYALPYQYYRRHRVRRYGFHGTSHRYVAYRYRTLTDKDKKDVNIITLHLGNGCSACAIKDGVSVDTSMGMTPLEGLVMGTRSGDIDPAILEYLAHKEGMPIDGLFRMLNQESGLLGISGLTNDMRELLDEERENQDRRARLAIDIFCKRIRRYIGAYLAELNGADAIIFTGGIGENSAEIRARIVHHLDWLGVELDDAANQSLPRYGEGKISTGSSRVDLYVIPTNEELLIARDSVRCVMGVS